MNLGLVLNHESTIDVAGFLGAASTIFLPGAGRYLPGAFVFQTLESGLERVSQRGASAISCHPRRLALGPAAHRRSVGLLDAAAFGYKLANALRFFQRKVQRTPVGRDPDPGPPGQEGIHLGTPGCFHAHKESMLQSVRYARDPDRRRATIAESLQREAKLRADPAILASYPHLTASGIAGHGAAPSGTDGLGVSFGGAPSITSSKLLWHRSFGIGARAPFIPTDFAAGREASGQGSVRQVEGSASMLQR